jgi:hypothetical protein
MSWSSLTNNQCVSCNNLQDGVNNNVFTLKNAIPVSNKEVTRNEAEFYVNIQNITNKSASQLVIKSDVISSGSTTTTSTTQVPSPCGTPTAYSGGFAYPTSKTSTVGSSTGNTTLTFDAQSVPDRFIVQWNGNYVIDTGYRGASSYNIGGGDRGGFNSSLTGKVDPITGLTYPNITQWPGDGYPLVVSPGQGNALFSKNASSPTTANIFVYAPLSGTAWSFTLGCPA